MSVPATAADGGHLDQRAGDAVARLPLAAALIREGLLVPGAKLPNERDLAQQLNTSRTAVRARSP